MPASDDDTLLPFSLPNLCKKKVTAAFDGGTISSDGGIFLLAGADRRLGLIDTLAALLPDERDPAQITHSMADNGKEVRAHLRRLLRRIRMHWPATSVTIRGDSHYGRKEVMDWCESNGVSYIFGLGPNKVLAEQVFPKLDETCVRRAIGQLDKARDFAVTRYADKSWSRRRRVVARIEVTRKGAVARHDGWPASDTRMAGRCASLRWPGVCEATRDFCRGPEGMECPEGSASARSLTSTTNRENPWICA
jgi:hypothetical protein